MSLCNTYLQLKTLVSSLAIPHSYVYQLQHNCIRKKYHSNGAGEISVTYSAILHMTQPYVFPVDMAQ